MLRRSNTALAEGREADSEWADSTRHGARSGSAWCKPIDVAIIRETGKRKQSTEAHCVETIGDEGHTTTPNNTDRRFRTGRCPGRIHYREGKTSSTHEVKTPSRRVCVERNSEKPEDEASKTPMAGTNSPAPYTFTFNWP